MNDQRLPVGEALPNWTPRPRPHSRVLVGEACRLIPLTPAHADDLFLAYQEGSASDWTYMGYDRPETPAATRAWIEALIPAGAFYAIEPAPTHKPAGVAAYIRTDQTNGSIEIAHINFAPSLKHSRPGTEAIYLLIKNAIEELGYRRCEWKCDSLNAASRRAAMRYGFSFEGIFRQAMVYKGRNRDTAWYSIIDKEWPGLKIAFDGWLQNQNFDSAGIQKTRLSTLTKAALPSR